MNLTRLRSIGFLVAACAVLVLPALPSALLRASDWPQWRGPARDGKSPEVGLMQSWPEGGPALAWSVGGLGAGYSSVSVSDGRIYTMGDLEDGQYAFALNQADGSLIWRTRVGAIHKDERGGSRSTPTSDGDRIYMVTTEGEVVCLNAANGAERWRRDMVDDFGGHLMKAMGSYDWRFSESPLVDGDRVVVTPGHIEALMVALDKRTGEEIWRTRGRRLGPVGADGAAYSSAVVSEAAGVRQYVQLIGRGLIGVEASTGKLLWNYNRVASDIANIATPVVRDDYVFGSAGYGTGSALVQIVRGDQGLEAKEVYFLEAGTLQNHHGGLILLDGVLYTGTGHNKGFPIAVDFLTGQVRWGPVRNQGRDSAAITYADQRLYLRYQDGRMILVEATPEAYREHGDFIIPDVRKESWAHPVVAGGKLYLKEQERLLCYDIRANSTE